MTQNESSPQVRVQPVQPNNKHLSCTCDTWSREGGVIQIYSQFILVWPPRNAEGPPAIFSHILFAISVFLMPVGNCLAPALPPTSANEREAEHCFHTGR